MTQGLHHVTAIAGPAARNLDFYARVLGLRHVKKTVNFDDPGTYHFYFGDSSGRPGSILTFFPWDHVAPGRAGVGQTVETAFSVPKASFGFWTQRFVERGVRHDAPVHRFGESVLTFRDPDGTALALVGSDTAAAEPAWTTEGIGPEAAIRGIAGVTLMVKDAGPTSAILTDVFGFVPAGQEGSRLRLRAPEAERAGTIDLLAVGGFLPAIQGAGSVHHIAFRAADDSAQAAMVARLRERHGIRTTEQLDRNYFRSVYFREPGGVLFEIATDDPGFAVDEPLETLGEALKLPAMYEAHRARIEEALPDLGPMGAERAA